MTVQLTHEAPSLIVRRMKKPLVLLALMLACAVPAFAQSEFGIIVGGSSRTADEALKADGAFLNDEFSLSNSVVDLFYAVQLEPGTYIKIKAGRIETPVAVDVTPPPPAGSPDSPTRVRRDVEGEVQHIEANAEYRFSEPFGTTGLFAGLGFYRHSGEDIETTTNYGFNVGANGDFPLSRRYGLLVEATYHWTRADFRPRYLTVGAGVRVSF
jgi:hypothetical protein